MYTPTPPASQVPHSSTSLVCGCPAVTDTDTAGNGPYSARVTALGLDGNWAWIVGSTVTWVISPPPSLVMVRCVGTQTVMVFSICWSTSIAAPDAVTVRIAGPVTTGFVGVGVALGVGARRDETADGLGPTVGDADGASDVPVETTSAGTDAPSTGDDATAAGTVDGVAWPTRLTATTTAATTSGTAAYAAICPLRTTEPLGLPAPCVPDHSRPLAGEGGRRLYAGT